MAKTSIYLPDDLAEQVRSYGIPISEVAQAALRQAVRTVQIRESVMTDIQAVADRLRETQHAEVAAGSARLDKARQAGIKWARERATAAELEYVASFDGPAGDYHAPESMYQFLWARGGVTVSSGTPTTPGDERWPYFQAGAREVWDAVRPLLAAADEHEGAAGGGERG